MLTLGSLFALQLQAQSGPGIDSPPAPGFLSLVADSTPISKGVLSILVMMSIACWGIFLYKWVVFKRAERQSAQFLDVFRRSNPRPAPVRPTLKSLPAVDRALMRASAVEVNKLEHRVPWLATTASVAPFIGLFGTVWGIIIAFQRISQSGSTNLQAVGPGISEALIATAAGLAAAIPAVLFYNHLTQRTKVFASEMDDFAMEFLNIAERNFT